VIKLLPANASASSDENREFVSACRAIYNILNGSRPDNDTIWTRSIVSAGSLRGTVEIQWGALCAQFDPEDARQLAHTLLREADNAETDSFLFDFFKKESNPELAQLLTVRYREHRGKLEQLAGVRKAGDEIPLDDAI